MRVTINTTYAGFQKYLEISGWLFEQDYPSELPPQTCIEFSSITPVMVYQHVSPFKPQSTGMRA